jgi:mercuric ion transport protein
MSTPHTRLLNAGAIGSAVAASVCCFGPLALAVLGLGGGASLLRFAPFRPYFLGLAVLLLGGAFYRTYRRPEEGCQPGSVCESPGDLRGRKIGLWIVAVIVAFAAVFPYIAGTFF